MYDSRTANQQTESLTGVVEKITFSAANDGYTIARLQVPGSKDLVTIVGNFANLQAGQTLRVKGYWKNHPKYGLQLNVVNYQETKPATLTGIEKYLGSGLVKGIGPVTAKRIVAYFGLETLEVIESNFDRLIEVPGIGHKRVKLIKDAWETQKAIKEVMVFLQGHGVSTTYAVKIYKQYGDGAIQTVTENPYQLADDIHNIGFLTADRIARNVGVSPWSKFRYRAGILYTLAEAGEDGHCFLPQPELVNRAVEKLSQDEYQAERAAVVSVIEEMAQKEELIVELAEGNMPLCYKPAFYYGEQNLAKLLKERLNQPLPVKESDVVSWLGRYTQSQGIDQELLIRFDQRDVTYDYADLNEIGLAYSISIHKSQGSEYPVVILPIYMQHFILLSKNLFYTGLTRAKQLAIVIGHKKPISIAVNQVKENLRYTRLKERLMV